MNLDSHIETRMSCIQLIENKNLFHVVSASVVRYRNDDFIYIWSFYKYDVRCLILLFIFILFYSWQISLLFTPDPTSLLAFIIIVSKLCCRKKRVVLRNLYMMFRFLPAQGKLGLQQVLYSRVWRDFRVMLSNQESVFTQLVATWFVARKVWNGR